MITKLAVTGFLTAGKEPGWQGRHGWWVAGVVEWPTGAVFFALNIGYAESAWNNLVTSAKPSRREIVSAPFQSSCPEIVHWTDTVDGPPSAEIFAGPIV